LLRLTVWRVCSLKSEVTPLPPNLRKSCLQPRFILNKNRFLHNQLILRRNMSNQIDQTDFTNNLYAILEETFETHHGVYLDKGDSLFNTLAGINAAEASQPVGGKCATLAAQVAHVNFYLEVLESYTQGQNPGKVDWGEIWQTMGAVTPEEWEQLIHNLRQTYERIMTMLRGFEQWDEDGIGGAMAMAIHTAYHLGEIRQALCTLR
jgi:hypothetical protein